MIFSDLIADLAVYFDWSRDIKHCGGAYCLALGEATTVAFASLAVVIARTLDKLDGYFSIIEKLGLISRKIEDVIIE